MLTMHYAQTRVDHGYFAGLVAEKVLEDFAGTDLDNCHATSVTYVQTDSREVGLAPRLRRRSDASEFAV